MQHYVCAGSYLLRSYVYTYTRILYMLFHLLSNTIDCLPKYKSSNMYDKFYVYSDDVMIATYNIIVKLTILLCTYIYVSLFNIKPEPNMLA